jgi:2'-5' RNA ligase
MRSFLGILPDENTKSQLSKVAAHVAAAFDTQQVPVSIIPASSLVVEVVPLNHNPNFLTKKKVAFRLRGYKFIPITISISSVRLGISKKDRGKLVFVINSGAEELRESVLELSKSLNIKREKIFVPHLSLGRVGKDISNEEFQNLSHDLFQLSKNELTENIVFKADLLSLIYSGSEGLDVVKNF